MVPTLPPLPDMVSPAAALTLLERLTAVAFVPGNQGDGLAQAILELLAEVLDVGLTFLSRVEGENLVVVRVHDRAAMGMASGEVIPLCDTYCQCLLADDLPSLVVPDTRAVPRFADLATTANFGIGAYAGVRLSRTDGSVYGTLCTLHTAARPVAPGEMAVLTVAGGILMQAIEAEEERQRAQQAQADVLAAAQTQAAYEAMACGVVVVDALGSMVTANTAARKMLHLADGAIPTDMALTAFGFLLDPDGKRVPEAERPTVRALRTGQPQRNIELGMRDADGRERWLLIDAVPLRAADGAVTQVVVSFLDLTARRRAEQQLRYQALHDAITGLPNRTFLQDRLEACLNTPRSGQGEVGLLLLDLDRFKEINDTFGHHYGDVLLREVAHRLRGAVHDQNLIARLGGDEFAVLLVDTNAQTAQMVGTALCDLLELPFMIDGHAFVVSGSIGVALAPVDGTDAATLLRHADVAMYTAKRGGAGFVRYHASDDRNNPERLALVADLRAALVEGGLTVAYQPQVDLHTGRVCGVEALARWSHPERGIISPAVFIPLAEQTGLITEVTHCVLEEAIAAWGRWRAAGHDLSLSVNLSTWDLTIPALPETLAALLAGARMPADRLRLEITETGMMADGTHILPLLARLRAMGMHLAVDDFGTGYSSLAYLKRLPVDEVKIDRAFVQEMGASGRDAEIVRMVIALGRSVGLRVVAEGVENGETWERLVALGCDVIQGYALSPPLAEAELQVWLCAQEAATGWEGQHSAGGGPA